jgi:hypothetical protein
VESGGTDNRKKLTWPPKKFSASLVEHWIEWGHLSQGWFNLLQPYQVDPELSRIPLVESGGTDHRKKLICPPKKFSASPAGHWIEWGHL